MKNRKTTSQILLGIIFSSFFNHAYSENERHGAEGDKYLRNLYSTVTISNVRKLRGDTSRLDSKNKDNLLVAKKVFTEFLIGVQNSDPKIFSYLSSGMIEKYPSFKVLNKKIFGAEVIVSFEIFEFNISDNSSVIEFRYFLTELTEGTECTTQRSVSLNSENDKWKISDFDAMKINGVRLR